MRKRWELKGVKNYNQCASIIKISNGVKKYHEILIFDYNQRNAGHLACGYQSEKSLSFLKLEILPLSHVAHSKLRLPHGPFRTELLR